MVMVVSHLFADSINLDLGAGSNHNKDLGTFNEDHFWKGVGYQYDHTSNISYKVEYAEFKNSYSNDTIFTGIAPQYLIGWDKFKVGGSLLIGYQKGYCDNQSFMGSCRANQDNESVLILPSFVGELDNLYVSVTGVPNAVLVWRFGVKVIEF